MYWHFESVNDSAFDSLNIEEQEKQMAKLDKVIGTLIKKNPNNFTGETVANFYKTQRK